MEIGNLNKSPRFVKASSLMGLQRKFRSLQFKENKQCRVINIYFDGSDHVAWYYDDKIDLEIEKTGE